MVVPLEKGSILLGNAELESTPVLSLAFSVFMTMTPSNIYQKYKIGHAGRSCGKVALLVTCAGLGFEEG